MKLQSLASIKKKIAGDITPKEFFTSKIFKEYSGKLSSMVARRYKTPVVVNYEWKEKDDDYVAYTDNRQIFVNLNNTIVSKFSSLEEKYTVTLGLLAHEIGHLLFTDFEIGNKFEEALKQNTLYPNPKPDYLGPKGIASLNNPKLFQINPALLANFYHNVSNIFEDAYIEKKMSENFPGSFKYCIQKSRASLFEDSFDLEKQYKKDKITAFMNSLLLYAFNQPTPILDDAHYPFWSELKSYLDANQLTDSSNQRAEFYEVVFIYLCELIFEVADKIQQDSKQGGANGNAQKCGTKGNANGNTQGDNAEGDTEGNGASNQALDKSLDSSLNNANKSSQQGKGTGVFADNSSDEQQSNASSQGQRTSNQKNESDNQQTSKSDKFVGSEEVGDIQKGMSDSGESESLLTAIELLSQIVDNKIRLDPALTRNVSDNIVSQEITKEHYQNQSYNIQNVSNDLSRKNEYDYVFNNNPLKTASKSIQRQILEVLEDARNGDYCTGMLHGTRISTSDIARKDGRVFKRTTLPGETPELAVSLLVDESGSMSGNRISQAMLTAMLVEDFCRGVDIPLSISGHYFSNNQTNIVNYIRFDETPNKTQKYRLAQMRVHGCNHDGMALRYVLKNIQNQEADNKLLILISDGQPAANGYSGACAHSDLRKIKSECKKTGVTLITAAIGEDKDIIQDIYKDSYLNISDVSRLPKAIINLLKKHIV